MALHQFYFIISYINMMKFKNANAEIFISILFWPVRIQEPSFRHSHIVDFRLHPIFWGFRTCNSHGWRQITPHAASRILTRGWRWGQRSPTNRTGCGARFIFSLPLQDRNTWCDSLNAWNTNLPTLRINRGFFFMGMVVMVWQAWTSFVFGATNWN